MTDRTDSFDEARWERRSAWWWETRAAFGGWQYVPPKVLPAFYAHPSDEQMRYVDAIDSSPAVCLSEALAIQETARKMTSRQAAPAWFTVPSVLPSRGELLGSVHAERKRCGKEGCKCESGREEDLHGPYYYRRWRDEDGTQRREHVPEEELGAVREAIEKRRARVHGMQTLRETYMEEARASRMGEKNEFGFDMDGYVERWTQTRKGAIQDVCPTFCPL